MWSEMGIIIYMYIYIDDYMPHSVASSGIEWTMQWTNSLLKPPRLQKSVCSDNSLNCRWRPETPHAEICSSFIYYIQYVRMNGMGKHISVDRG